MDNVENMDNTECVETFPFNRKEFLNIAENNKINLCEIVRQKLF